MCNARGGGRGFLCPQGTKFSQKTMVCDFAKRVKCEQSSNFFHRNVIIHEASLAATKPSNNLRMKGFSLKSISRILVPKQSFILIYSIYWESNTKILFDDNMQRIWLPINNLPTNARITVRRGAAGNEMFVLNSSICSSSTMNTNIWCCEYLKSIDIETVWNENVTFLNYRWCDEFRWIGESLTLSRQLQIRNKILWLTKTIITKAATMYADDEVHLLTKW